MLRNAFMTQRQLAARGLPLRAPMHRLTGLAKTGVGIALAVQIGCVVMAGTARNSTVVMVCGVVLVLGHVATYLIESRPASLKPRRARST